MHTPTLSYWTCQPNRWTFESTKLRNWVKERLSGNVLNACCGPTSLDYEPVHRNDLQKKIKVTVNGESRVIHIDADSYCDIRELHTHLNDIFDTIIFDPPFTENQSKESYNQRLTADYDETTVDALESLIRPGGIILQFGYTSTMFAMHDAFTLEELAVFNTLGRMDDWIATKIRYTPNEANTIQKATTEDQPQQTRSWTTSASVTPNSNAEAGEDTTTTGNSGESITLRYHRLSPDQSLSDMVSSTLNELVTSPVLHVTGRNDIDLQTGEFDFEVGLRSEVTGCDAYFDERGLHAALGDSVFDTAVLTPHRELFQQNIDYDGETRGRDAVLKREVIPLVASRHGQPDRGRVIQLGRTTTCVPKSAGYTRETIIEIAHPEYPYDVFVTVDRSPPILSPNGLVNQRRSGEERTHAELDTLCPFCGLGEARRRVYDMWCPRCGALPNNQCVTETGTPLQTPHEARRRRLPDQHGLGKCTPPPSQGVRDVTTTDGTTSSTQSGLTEFND